MKFRNAIVIYVLIWIVLIVGFCFYEWSALSDFQMSYTDEIHRKNILSDLKNAGNTNSETRNNTDKSEPDDTQAYTEYTIIVDSTMKISVDGKEPVITEKSEIEDGIYSDMSELTGADYHKYRITLKAQSKEAIVVTTASGNRLMADENDYVAATYTENTELSQMAVSKFEPYLKHISGLTTLSELSAVMDTSGKAYKAVVASQKSLEWMIKAKSITFTREDVSNMQIFDDEHFACDISIDLTKIPDTERERTVDETVDYRVLFRYTGGGWYIYSFVTK